MARHAEESRDDLQAMKALNVFYQVRFMLFFFFPIQNRKLEFVLNTKKKTKTFCQQNGD